ncbi:hypothetical protein M9Y10_020808 [Tritrichomonas musculus]|uniref:Protein kinase domain-containing protein n=1 Tax=Tritrichomonas musculus TaxID=1915356 RepID=A0ABR2HEQ2_9EUKA
MINAKTEDGYHIKMPRSFNGYLFKEIVGSGSSSIVCLVECENTGELRSAKIIPQKYIKDRKLKRQIDTEISVMQKIDHSNIVKFHESFVYTNDSNDSYAIIVMEYCENGDLFNYVLNDSNGFDKDPKKNSILNGIISAIKYLHSLGIAHGDIKPENVLLDSNFNSKLSDFGYCKTEKIVGDESKNGSLHYAAPELLAKGYFDPLKADIWAIGILLFCLSQKSFPYKGNSPQYIIHQIIHKKIHFHSSAPRKLRNVVELCTQLKPSDRPSINELAYNDYFYDDCEKEDHFAIDIFDCFSNENDQFWSNV